MEHVQAKVHPFWGPVIYAYTRQDAIRDGILIDVSEMAKEAGIRPPTAVTQTVWEQVVVPPEAVKGVQSEKGRLWDILWMLRCAALRSRSSTVRFALMVRNSYKRPAQKIFLKAVIGPGDYTEPVITIMMPFED